MQQTQTMSIDELLHRLRRLYAAVGAMKEFDLGKFPAKLTLTECYQELYQDFVGGLDNAQVENLAHTAISLVAHFENHLQRWAKQNGKELELIREDVTKSEALALLKDLANFEKHGPERSGGHSGLSPRLVEVKRILRLQTGPTAGSGVSTTQRPAGLTVHASAGGKAFVVVEGRIVDGNGATIADLHDTLLKGVDALSALAKRVGVPE